MLDKMNDFLFYLEIIAVTVDCNTISVFFEAACAAELLFAGTDCIVSLLALRVSWWSRLDVWCSVVVISPQRHDQSAASL